MKTKIKVGGLILPDFKTYYKYLVIKMVQYWYANKHRSAKENRSPEIDPQVYGQLIFNHC